MSLDISCTELQCNCISSPVNASRAGWVLNGMVSMQMPGSRNNELVQNVNVRHQMEKLEELFCGLIVMTPLAYLINEDVYDS